MVALIPAIVNIIGLIFIAFCMALTALLVVAMLMRQLSPMITEPLRRSFSHLDDINMPEV